MSIKSRLFPATLYPATLYPLSRTRIFTRKLSRFTIGSSTQDKPTPTWWGALPWDFAEPDLRSRVIYNSPSQSVCASEIGTDHSRNIGAVALGMTLAAGVSASFWTGLALLLSKILH
jgi:hypothetical protein